MIIVLYCIANGACYMVRAPVVVGIAQKPPYIMQVMNKGFDAAYQPNKNNIEWYNKRFEKYKGLGRFMEQ
jgi:hypothetical protein